LELDVVIRETREVIVEVRGRPIRESFEGGEGGGRGGGRGGEGLEFENSENFG
jgi:hypothetical protein